jgi:hypothetical protein
MIMICAMALLGLFQAFLNSSSRFSLVFMISKV